MPATYVNIASTTLGSATNTVTFSSIPQTYTDLLLRVSASSDSGSGNWFTMRFNGVASDYSSTRIRGNGSDSSSGRESNSSSFFANGFDFALGVSTTIFGSSELYIPNYTASTNKPVYLFNVTEENSSSAFITSVAGLWRNSSAISSISITAGGGFNAVAGSTFYLYGIKNS